jgi:hypothetical protein
MLIYWFCKLRFFKKFCLVLSSLNQFFKIVKILNILFFLFLGQAEPKLLILRIHGCAK